MTSKRGKNLGLRRGAPLAGLAAFLLVGSAVLAVGPDETLPTAQPIPFSHRIHAGRKEIGCFLCHPGAQDSARAGIPPLETCLLCHQHVIIHHPWIERLRRHAADGEAVVWNRVNQVPDFVYFDHAVHVRRGFDCSRCHGDVRAMDRIERPHKLTMGFCIECHREHGATHDCFTCHR